MKIEAFVGRFFSKKDLQDICKREKLPLGGLKDDLIERLIRDSGYSISDFIDWMNIEDLQNVCRDLKLPISENRDDLVQRIVKVFQIVPPKLEKWSY